MSPTGGSGVRNHWAVGSPKVDLPFGHGFYMFIPPIRNGDFVMLGMVKTSITALGLHGFIMVYHTKNVISPDRPVDQTGVACATSSAAGSSPGAAPWRIANVTWRTPSRWWWLEAIPDMWGLGEPELPQKICRSFTICGFIYGYN